MKRSIWLLAAALGGLALLMPLGAGAGKTKPNVTFKSGNYNVNESTSPAAITVTLSAKSQNLLTVWFRTAGGSATGGASCAPGVDFINTDTQMVFNPGQTQLTASVPICNDTLDEPNETVTLQLYNPSNNLSLGSKSQSTLTIVDDDPAPSISVNDTSANEGDPVTFNLTLSAPSGQPVSVNYTTAANGTASAAFYGALDNVCGPPSNPDYVSAAGGVAFAPGETSRQVSITTCADFTAEADETFTLNLSSPINASIADGTGVGTIDNVGCATNAGTGENSDNLQTIIDDASAGDAIDIRGTCFGHFNTTKNLTLAGVANTSPTLDGQNNGRVFLVQSGVSVAFNDLSITNGNYVFGAGILNRGTVTLNGSTSVSGNAGGSSGNGAGIANGDSVGTSTLIMNDSSSVSGNTAGIDGPGIYNNGGTVTMNDSSTVHDNSSGGSGGGIYNGGGTVTMNDSSSVYGNSTFNGGGIFSFNSLTLNGSASVHDNTAVRGGGIYSTVGFSIGGTVTLNGSTSVYGNTATGDGGGIDNHSATVVLYAASAVHDNNPNDCLNC